MALNKKVFTLKSYGAELYTWSPIPTDKKSIKAQKPFYCNATPNSQGQDWVTTYSYNLGVTNGVQEHLAYVECDYVE
jgi:hypothetical protein